MIARQAGLDYFGECILNVVFGNASVFRFPDGDR